MSAQIADVLVMGVLVWGDNVTRADVLISDGGVREVGSDLSRRDARRVIDAAGRHILPDGRSQGVDPVPCIAAPRRRRLWCLEAACLQAACVSL